MVHIKRNQIIIVLVISMGLMAGLYFFEEKKLSIYSFDDELGVVNIIFTPDLETDPEDTYYIEKIEMFNVSINVGTDNVYVYNTIITHTVNGVETTLQSGRILMNHLGFDKFKSTFALDNEIGTHTITAKFGIRKTWEDTTVYYTKEYFKTITTIAEPIVTTTTTTEEIVTTTTPVTDENGDTIITPTISSAPFSFEFVLVSIVFIGLIKKIKGKDYEN